MLQTFTCCTFPQAKERTREVKSLTLFSRLEILTSFTRLFAKSPHACQIVLSWLPYLRSIGMQPRVSYLSMPLHLPHQWYYGQWASVLHRNIEWAVDRVSDGGALNAQLLKSFPILRKCLSMRLSNPTYFFPYVGNSRCWEILLKEDLHAIPRSNWTWENGEKPCLCCPF